MQRKLLLALAWIFAVGIAAQFLSAIRRAHPPDFMPFYFAGKLAASGRVREIYHQPSYQPLIQELRATGERMNPIDAHYFIRPSFQAFAYIPFSWFSYSMAWKLQVAMNLAILGVLVWKLPLWFSLPVAFRPCLLAFYPFLWSVGIGQDTLPLTLLVAWSLRLASQGRELPAGVVLGLCAFKPHLVWAMPLALLAAGKRRMFIAAAATGGLLAAISMGMVGTAGLAEWSTLLEAPSTDFLPQIMGNVRALGLRLGPVAWVLAGAFTGACLGLVLRRGAFGEQLSAAIFAALLLSPHTYWQDYSLAAVVAALSNRRAVQYLLLVPWPFFYPRNDMLPWIFLALAFLGATAARGAVRAGSLGRAAPVTPAC